MHIFGESELRFASKTRVAIAASTIVSMRRGGHRWSGFFKEPPADAPQQYAPHETQVGFRTHIAASQWSRKAPIPDICGPHRPAAGGNI